MFGQQASERSHAWSERFWPTKMIPGRGTSSDVWSSGHRPCPGEQALPRRHALLHFALRDLPVALLQAATLPSHAHAQRVPILTPLPMRASTLDPRGHRTCLAHRLRHHRGTLFPFPLRAVLLLCQRFSYACLCKRISPPPSAVENSPQPSQYRSSAQAAS